MISTTQKLLSVLKKSPWEDFDQNSGSDKFKFKHNFNPNFNINPQFSFKIVILLIVAMILGWLSTGFFKVDEKEQAIILRFGKFARTATAGLNYHLPKPIETHLTEEVFKLRKIEIGFRSSAGRKHITSGGEKQVNANAVDVKPLKEESIMLTSDENMVDVNCNIMWRIKNAKNYVFNIKDQEKTIKTTSGSALREIIGKTPISDIIGEVVEGVNHTNRRAAIEQQIKELTQNILDQYQAGVVIEEVQLLKVDPPAEVIDAYRDVQTSRADKEREINQAEAYKNDILPRARGRAAQITKDAEAYKQERIITAEGEVNKYLALYDKYKHNKDIMKDRLYLDTMEQLFKDSNKTIINNNNILPHIQMDK